MFDVRKYNRLIALYPPNNSKECSRLIRLAGGKAGAVTHGKWYTAIDILQPNGDYVDCALVPVDILLNATEV